MTNFVNMII